MANEQAVAEEVTNYKNLNSRIKLKHDTEANWEKATNFTPLSGEICLYTDIKKFKVGDGSTKINNLPFFTNLEDVNSLIDTAIQALTLTEPITIEPSVINGFLSLSLEEENGIITKLEGSVTHQTNKKDVAGIVSAPGSSHNNSAWMTDGAGNPAWRTLPLNPNNSINQAGIVTAPTSSNPNKAWMTDSSGNPGWRAFPLNPVNTVNQAGIVEAPTSSNAYKAWMTDANGNPGWRSNIPNRYIKVLSAGDTEVQIPFDYDNQESNLTVYYNGILMDSPANYNVNTATNTIELEGEAEAGDVITIMGLMGAVSIDFNQ